MCVCVSVRAFVRACGGEIFEEEFVHVNIVCFDVSCFYLESEMYATTVTMQYACIFYFVINLSSACWMNNNHYYRLQSGTMHVVYYYFSCWLWYYLKCNWIKCWKMYNCCALFFLLIRARIGSTLFPAHKLAGSPAQARAEFLPFPGIEGVKCWRRHTFKHTSRSETPSKELQLI